MYVCVCASVHFWVLDCVPISTLRRMIQMTRMTRKMNKVKVKVRKRTMKPRRRCRQCSADQMGRGNCKEHLSICDQN